MNEGTTGGERTAKEQAIKLEQDIKSIANGAQSNDHDSESDDEVLEESPCGRWQKRRDEIQQQEVPGIDHSFLAMDTEEGVEVAWNEVLFSEKKRKLNAKQEEIKCVFDNLINLEHANIAKLHKYWFDSQAPNPRIIFITEFMSSGSLKNFLMRAPKRSHKAWKRWTTQILSALSYLHACEPPIIHGNLTLDMIFLQHNGLIKISSVAPDAIHNHVRTCTKQIKNMHYAAPEYETTGAITPAVDIYSFGICALGMLTKNIIPFSSDQKEVIVTPEVIQKAIESIEDEVLKDFVTLCLRKNPAERPSARKLLFHPALFEIHALKLISAHAFVQYLGKIMNETLREERQQSLRVDPSSVIATIKFSESSGKPPLTWTFSQVPAALELEKFVEDVKNGVYPILNPRSVQNTSTMPRPISPECGDNSEVSEQPRPAETWDAESRSVMSVSCLIEDRSDALLPQLVIQLRLDDKLNRQLVTDYHREDDSAAQMAAELVKYGLINERDRIKISSILEDEQKAYSVRIASAAEKRNSLNAVELQPPNPNPAVQAAS